MQKATIGGVEIVARFVPSNYRGSREILSPSPRAAAGSSGADWSDLARTFELEHGWLGEAAHKRPPLNPDELGRLLARVDDSRRPGGCLLSFQRTSAVGARVNYLEYRRGFSTTSTHPNHPPHRPYPNCQPGRIQSSRIPRFIPTR